MAFTFTSNKGNTYIKGNKTPTTQSGQFVMHSKMHRSKNKAAPAGRAPVDDVTWDSVVKGLMEEYDEAWTALADK